MTTWKSKKKKKTWNLEPTLGQIVHLLWQQECGSVDRSANTVNKVTCQSSKAVWECSMGADEYKRKIIIFLNHSVFIMLLDHERLLFLTLQKCCYCVLWTASHNRDFYTVRRQFVSAHPTEFLTVI